MSQQVVKAQLGISFLRGCIGYFTGFTQGVLLGHPMHHVFTRNTKNTGNLSGSYMCIVSVDLCMNIMLYSTNTVNIMSSDEANNRMVVDGSILEYNKLHYVL